MEGMYKNKERDTKKVLIIIAVVVVIIAVVLIAMLVSELVNDKEEKTTTTSTTTKSTLVTYQQKSTEILGTLTSSHTGELDGILDNDKNIRIYYPQMTGVSSDIASFNQMIENKITSITNNYNESINPANTNCFTIRPVGEVAPRAYEYYTYYKYSVTEYKDYFFINEKQVIASSCATGSEALINSYNIDKATGTVETIKEYGAFNLVRDYIYSGINTTKITGITLTFLENKELLLVSQDQSGQIEYTKGKYTIDGQTITYTREYSGVTGADWQPFDINANEKITSPTEVFTITSDNNIETSSTSYYAGIVLEAHS